VAEARAPDLEALGRFEHLDGVLIDTPASAAAIRGWQDRSAKDAAERYHLSFADAALQRRWLLLASPDEYVEKIMTWTRDDGHRSGSSTIVEECIDKRHTLLYFDLMKPFEWDEAKNRWLKQEREYLSNRLFTALPMET